VCVCRTIADECCFEPPPSPGVVSYQLRGWVERDLCGSRPWLVLHKARSVPTVCPDWQRGLHWPRVFVKAATFMACMASLLQVVETEQMVFLGDRVRNCTRVLADNEKSKASAAALPAASDTTAKT
jgi:hypothetical protein